VLILADANTTLHAHGFILQGAFLAGSATCRLRSYINITLHGTRPQRQAIRASLEWAKGFAVTGRMELHGALSSATWSRLAQEVLPGDRVVFTQDSLNWEPGQNVVLTTTALKNARDFSEMETFNITRIWRLSADHPATAAELSRPVKYRHYVVEEYQAELALLSRRLTVQGSETDSEPADIFPIACTSPTCGSFPCGNSSPLRWPHHGHGQRGALRLSAVPVVVGFTTSRPPIHPPPHTVYVEPFVDVPGIDLRPLCSSAPLELAGYRPLLSGAQLYRMGQTNVLARYPAHFHQIGNNANRSYIQDSSIWRSFYRCVSIHSVNGLTVTRNVAYDAIGQWCVMGFDAAALACGMC